MARRDASPQQIIRKDGNNCFVEASNASFEIGKVLLKFVTYDLNRPKGDRFTNTVDIYLDFSSFLRISNDFLNGSLYRKLMEDKRVADEATRVQGTKVWAKQTIIHQGGKMDGQNVIARVLKMFAGDKIPIMFKAEQGMGEKSRTGLFIPKYGNKPDQYVQIGMTIDDAKEFFLTINEHINAYLGEKYFNAKYDERLKRLEAENTLLKDVLLEVAKGMNINIGAALNSYNQKITAIENEKKTYTTSSNPAPTNNGYNNSYNNQYQQNNNTYGRPAYPQNAGNYDPNMNRGNISSNPRPAPAPAPQAPHPQRSDDNFMNIPEEYITDDFLPENDFFS